MLYFSHQFPSDILAAFGHTHSGMPVAFILVCVTILVVSFSCSLTEAVLLSLNPLLLKVRQSRGIADAGRWLALKNKIERPVSAILIFNTLANTGLVTIAGALFEDIFGAGWLWLFSVVITVLILFGTEMAPKIYGVHHAENLAPHLIMPLTWMLWVCHPLVTVMDRFCEKLKSTPSSSTGKNLSSQIMDIITLTQAAKAEQVLHNREEIIIIHAATLSARRVRRAMVPREAVKMFQVGRTLLENVEALGPKLHRSYPVCIGGAENTVTGYIRIRELFAQNLRNNDAGWTTLIRPVLHVEGGISLTQLLALFLEKQDIAALVHDPLGSTLGWITMDDVMKALMGQRI